MVLNDIRAALSALWEDRARMITELADPRGLGREQDC